MNVSLSAYEAFQRCEQLYEYGWVRKLTPAAPDVAPHRGNLIHEYLETYYRALQSGEQADSAYAHGLEKLDSHRTELELAASLHAQVGRADDAAAFLTLLPDVGDILRRYHNLHGRADADRHEVMLVEETIVMPIIPNVPSIGKIDLVTRDRIGGRIWLWEHKSTGNVPEMGVRLWNLQTLLYAEKLRRTRDIEVDGVLWNYIRTKLPSVPELLKGRKVPQLSRATQMDTNWETYEAALRWYALNPADYIDVRERLMPREREVYFPRFEHVIVADRSLFLRDYATVTIAIRRKRWEWEQGVSQPVRTLSRNCSWCRFSRLCEATLMGGDEEDLIKRLYTVKTREPEPEMEVPGG